MARIFGSSEKWTPEASTCSIKLEGLIRPSKMKKWDVDGLDVGEGPRSLKVACLSDTHGRYRSMEDQLTGADLIIFAGDLLDYRQKDSASLADLNAWIADLKMKKEQLLFVAGNHDTALCHAGNTYAKRAAALPGVTYLERSMTTVVDGNVTVAGGPWVLGRPFYFMAQCFAVSGSTLVDRWTELTDLVLQMNKKRTITAATPTPTTTTTESSSSAEKSAPDDSYLDILVSHGPPEGVFDIDYKKRRTGTVTLRDITLAKTRPLVHVFGHNHDQSGCVWGTLCDSGKSDYSDHRMLFVGAAATFTHVCQYFTLHY